MNVDGLIAEKDLLLVIDGDDHALFGDLFHGAGFGDVDFNTRLQHRRRDHEDDEQHQHHVNQGVMLMSASEERVWPLLLVNATVSLPWEDLIP